MPKTTTPPVEITKCAKDLEIDEHIVIVINGRPRQGIVLGYDPIPIDPKTGKDKEDEPAILHWRTIGRPAPRKHQVRPETAITIDPEFIAEPEEDDD